MTLFDQKKTELSLPRRRFLQAAVAGLGTLGMSQLVMGGTDTAGLRKARSHKRDYDILNFALNLEYLEAEYYLRGALGRGLADADTTGAVGTLGAVTGGRQVNFATPVFRQYAEEIAADEEAHVKLLRSAIPAKLLVARPAIDLQASFAAAAVAAGIKQAGDPPFDPFADEDSFILGAFVFEDVGVTAYHGAAPLLADRNLLLAAAGLLGVEAYHAGEIRTLLTARGLSAAANKISDLRDSADGTDDLDQGITDANGNVNIVPTDANGLVFARTPGQVASIVFLGGSGKGGFLPAGLNGRLTNT
jgi:hypothetical protein